MVYPPDLDDYPDGKDGGYMNEFGHMTQWYKRPAIEPEGGYESVSMLPDTSFFFFSLINDDVLDHRVGICLIFDFFRSQLS